jgi:nitroreductase
MEFFDVIERRHSVRKFTDKPLTQEQIDALISVANSAPSSRNSKSTAFLIIEDRDTLEALSQMREYGSSLIKGAQAAFVLLGDPSKTDLWVDNCAICATMIQLAATNLGLGSCWVHINGRTRAKLDDSQGYAEDYVRELLGVKDEMRIYNAIALGYEAVLE